MRSGKRIWVRNEAGATRAACSVFNCIMSQAEMPAPDLAAYRLSKANSLGYLIIAGLC